MSRRSSITELSFFDPWFYADGIASLGRRPRSGNLLELLGRDEEERVEAVAELIRQSSEAEVEQLTRIVQQALAVVAQERAEGHPTETARRQRGQSAVERRAERRRRATS